MLTFVEVVVMYGVRMRTKFPFSRCGALEALWRPTHWSRKSLVGSTVSTHQLIVLGLIQFLMKFLIENYWIIWLNRLVD
jgi:hypothetical protein